MKRNVTAVRMSFLSALMAVLVLSLGRPQMIVAQVPPQGNQTVPQQVAMSFCIPRMFRHTDSSMLFPDARHPQPRTGIPPFLITNSEEEA
jgi:hypothetical protein